MRAVRLCGLPTLLALACAFVPVTVLLAGDALPRKGTLGVQLAQDGDAVRIVAVFPGTTADQAGLRPDDVLLAIDGRTIGSVSQLIETVATLTVGQTFEVAFLRAGGRMTSTPMFKERPRDRGGNFDVMYDHVVSHGARIRTIVTRPHAPGKHPVLFLIQGLGPATIDQPLTGPDAYSRILSAFATSEYVTVRTEKPGIGDSEGGPYIDTDFETELDVYRQALMATKKYEFVDPDAVFVFGHSIGGVFGPILAAEIPINGIAVYGTVAKTWTEYVLENTRRQGLLARSDPARLDSTLRDLASVVHSLLVDRKTPDEIRQTRPELRATLARFVQDGRMYGRSVSFWSQLASKNLPAHWAQGNAHVLAIWGRHDFIATEADHPLIAASVNRARPGRGTYVVLEDADHGFYRTTSIEDSFRRWSAPGGEFDPRIITMLREWIERARRGGA